MQLEAVAYTSSAVHDMTVAELEQLLLKSRAKNAELGVTGVLLFHDGSFFQYFEGPPAAVEEVYARIRRSPLHQDIIELLRGPIRSRSFGAWLMGFTQAPASTLLSLSNASWEARVRQEHAVAPTAASEGLELLLQFWNSNRGALYQ